MKDINSNLIDVVLDEPSGYPDECAGEDTFDALWDAAGDAAREFPKHLFVEPNQWPQVAAENDKNGTWPINWVDRFTNQSPSHECTTHCLRTVAEACRNRQRAIQLGPPVPKKMLDISKTSASVWLSCMSIYAEANPGKWGGASVRGVMEIAVRRGFIPDKTQPRDWGFKHTLIGTNGDGNICQSAGPWVAMGKFPDGWNETAKHFRPLEIIIPESWEQIVSLVLNGYAVGVGRSGHSIPYCRWVQDKQMMEYPDSYDLFRYDSPRMIRAAVGSAYAIASFTTPDDWEKPCG